ncbi:hypothetical protein OHA74_54225 [Streptomyces phaeochromogenes]|uniref:hypothetical protein n=1 Tax=Streptomyces phaeochromogenes TaxID=1923 RepID=UPI002E2A2BD6|nr:hypothetical protein [Streptomyces phaeochromogenes]
MIAYELGCTRRCGAPVKVLAESWHAPDSLAEQHEDSGGTNGETDRQEGKLESSEDYFHALTLREDRENHTEERHENPQDSGHHADRLERSGDLLISRGEIDGRFSQSISEPPMIRSQRQAEGQAG